MNKIEDEKKPLDLKGMKRSRGEKKPSPDGIEGRKGRVSGDGVIMPRCFDDETRAAASGDTSRPP